jgi:hypothetical protein
MGGRNIALASSRLGPTYFVFMTCLLVVWPIPDWLYKLHLLAEARRRSRGRGFSGISTEAARRTSRRAP